MAVKLSKRLSTAAHAVRRGRRAADVGCDHGKLTAYLVEEGICPRAVAADISADSLAKAERLFDELGLRDRIKTALCDGLSGIAPDSFDDVVIGGVGFETTAHIIETCPELKDSDKRLVLIPASHADRLRRYLYENGFALLSEAPVADDGRCYTVMTAAYTGEKLKLLGGFAALGLIKNDSDDARAYIKREAQKANRIISRSTGERKIAAAREVLRYIEEELL